MTSVDIVIPVYNEEDTLEKSIGTLREFMMDNLRQTWRIVIADNASNDKTLSIARSLSERYGDVGFLHLDEKGRGRALRRAWLESDADILTYMDVDLATGLEAFSELVRAIEEDGYDIVIGSRLATGAEIKRSVKREFFSRGYNFLIKAMFRVRFHDAQCGFKAISRDAARVLLPLTEDNGWFFDTELLLLAEALGYHVKEVPVVWTESARTTVNITRTVVRDLQGLFRLRFFPSPEVRAKKKLRRGTRQMNGGSRGRL
jgi:glycosyltransferase involved in cell wall biosynthesis